MITNILVKDIVKETTNRSITVKVLRSWCPTDQQKKPVSLECILMDSEGSQIGGYVKRSLLSNFKASIKEGDTVKITKFLVEENTQHKWMKARVNHPFKIHFGYVTKVVTCTPDKTIGGNGFNLLGYESLEMADPQYFVDVIGRLAKRGEITLIDKINARKLDLEVEDESNRPIKVVLWESFADNLLEEIQKNDHNKDGVNIILQFGVKTEWNNEIRVTTSVNATKLFINSDIPEFEDFRLRKQDFGGRSTSRSITFLSAEPRTLKPEEWLNMDAHRTQEQLLKHVEAGSFILFINLDNVDSDGAWKFNACSNCLGKVKDADVGDKCFSAKCDGREIKAIIPRFRVRFHGPRNNDNECLKLIIFEDIITKYIGKTAIQVQKEIDDGGDPMKFPMDFECMLGRDYLLKVRVAREFNIERGYKDISVDYLTDDELIIQKYKDLSIGEANSKAIEKTADKGKAKVDVEVVEIGDNEDIGNLTPAKRVISGVADEDNEAGSDPKFKKSANRPIKKEKI